MSEQNSAENQTLERIRPQEIMDELNIKKDKYYGILKTLGIKAAKDSDKKAYLSEGQANRIRAYFSGNSNSLESEVSSNSLLVKDGDSNLDTSSNGSLVKTSEGELATPASQENIYVKPDEPTAGLDVNKLVRSAAELKARELAMGDLVKRSLADKMTYGDLPQDLKDCVDEAHQAANPDFFPQDIASQLLEQHRATV